jgi:hypothetical protein
MLELHFGDSVMIVRKASTLECFVDFPHPPKFHTFQSTSGALHEERWMDSRVGGTDALRDLLDLSFFTFWPHKNLSDTTVRVSEE